MSIYKILGIIFLIVVCSYLVYNSYLIILDVQGRKKQHDEIELEIEKQRFDYLRIMLDEKEVVENTDLFIEREARKRLKYAKEGETVIYYGNDFDQEYYEYIVDLNKTEKSLSPIEVWMEFLF